MPETKFVGLTIRRALPADAPEWIELIKASLGPDYAARQAFDSAWAAQQLDESKGDETWVAEANGRLRASISILRAFSANENPVANLGRYLVSAEGSQDRSGEALLRKLNEICIDRRHMAMLRVPASDRAQQMLLEKIGFACVGFQPSKHLYRVREGILFYVRVGSSGPVMRLAISQSLGQVNELASAVLENLSIPNPDVVRDGATGYPVHAELQIDECTLAAYEARERQIQPSNPPIEISAQFNRGLGVLRIGGTTPVGALLGSREGKLVAGLSYYYDEFDRCVRLVDSFSSDDLSSGAMLQRVLKLAHEKIKALYVEVDFLITATRLLKSAEQLGFVPVAFLPGRYKRAGCCVDIVKMVKLYTDYAVDYESLTTHASGIVTIVDRNFQDQKIGVSVIDLLRALSAFEGLGDGELAKMGRLFAKKLYQPNELVFNKGDLGEAAYIIMRGQVEIRLTKDAAPIATLGAGAIFGEQAFLEGAPRNAFATTTQPSILLVVQRAAFTDLIASEPHLGMVVMRNIALELSRRLRSADVTLAQPK